MNLALAIAFFPLRILLDILRWILRCFNFQSNRNLSGKVVLVTGAASGIGRAISCRFAALGCILVLWDIDGKRLDDVRAEISGGGGHAYSYICDVSSRDDIYRVAKRVETDVGRVDVLVNSAGLVSGQFLIECVDEEIEKVMGVNTMAHFWTCKAFLPGMIKRNFGHVVTISSAMGFAGAARLIDYCSSKFAVVGFSESLQYELKRLGCTDVGVSLVCPWVLSDSKMFRGARYKFDSIVSPTTADSVAHRVVTAVQRNEFYVMVPWWIHLFVLVKGMIPHDSLTYLLEVLGAETAMDTFKGQEE